VGLISGLDTEVRGKNPLPLPGIEFRPVQYEAKMRFTILNNSYTYLSYRLNVSTCVCIFPTRKFRSVI
jgi:hypothetical protein